MPRNPAASQVLTPICISHVAAVWRSVWGLILPFSPAKRMAVLKAVFIDFTGHPLNSTKWSFAMPRSRQWRGLTQFRDRQPIKQKSRSKSQLRLIGSLLTLVDTQLLPQSCRHKLNKLSQRTTQLAPSWAILFFGMGVKSPAKPVVTEVMRIIATIPSLM
jgi:hypothetical protein